MLLPLEGLRVYFLSKSVWYYAINSLEICKLYLQNGPWDFVSQQGETNGKRIDFHLSLEEIFPDLHISFVYHGI